MKRHRAAFFAILFVVSFAIAIIADRPSPARTRCKTAVVAYYESADRVLEQPLDLDGFCAAWHDHPPGYELP